MSFLKKAFISAVKDEGFSQKFCSFIIALFPLLVLLTHFIYWIPLAAKVLKQGLGGVMPYWVCKRISISSYLYEHRAIAILGSFVILSLLTLTQIVFRKIR